jgi:hypothetical protein
MGGRKMTVLSMVLIVFIILGLIATLIFSVLSKDISGLKIMLLGINLTIFGVLIAVDSSHNYGGIVYLIAISGLIISAIGLMKKDKF